MATHPPMHRTVPYHLQQRINQSLGPVAKTALPMQGAQVQSLVWELDSHMLHLKSLWAEMKILCASTVE